MEHHSFNDMLLRWWQHNQNLGWIGHGFIQKLKILIQIMKLGNKDTLGCTQTKKIDLLNELGRLDDQEEAHGLDQIGQQRSEFY